MLEMLFLKHTDLQNRHDSFLLSCRLPCSKNPTVMLGLVPLQQRDFAADWLGAVSVLYSQMHTFS